ncbi:MAG: hypothetical protein DDT34_02344 [Firmicutes bacterium]|nr:hypothetical protein [Bacillota bacterium]
MARRETGPWNAAALPEIMAGALQESKYVAMCDGGQTGEQQALNFAAKLKCESVKLRKAMRLSRMRHLGLRPMLFNQ